jgi:hypothetical protein
MLFAIKEQGDFGYEWINTILIWGVSICYPLWLIKGAVKWVLQKWRGDDEHTH